MTNKTKQAIKEKKELKAGEEKPVKIGLEIHGYLDTKEKLFCKCSSIFTKGEIANSRVCPICTGQPGSKPMMPNEKAMEQLIKISLVLNCKINYNKPLTWMRKHYNWADLPKGYQNTISGAHAEFPAVHGKFKGIGITECHLEEDPAQWNPETGEINYNRSGMPLIEIVTDPDFANSEQVGEWMESLIHHLSYIKAINPAMGIKVDTNVSTYGDRVEIKNIHSVEDMKKAIEYEIKRQLENHSKGIEQKRDTLSYDSKKGITIKMREKESGEDYRFIPDPDLPAIKIQEKQVKQIEMKLPENPDKKLEKLLDKYKVSEEDAKILAKNIALVDFFEALVNSVAPQGVPSAGGNAAKYVSWITIELLRILNYNKKTLDDSDLDIKPEHLAELIKEVDSGKITVLKAKQIMNDFVPKSFSIKAKAGEFAKIDEKEVENLCKQAISKNPKVVEDFKSGKQEALNYLVGEVMKLSNRRADFRATRELLGKMLK